MDWVIISRVWVFELPLKNGFGKLNKAFLYYYAEYAASANTIENLNHLQLIESPYSRHVQSQSIKRKHLPKEELGKSVTKDLDCKLSRLHFKANLHASLMSNVTLNDGEL